MILTNLLHRFVEKNRFIFNWVFWKWKGESEFDLSFWVQNKTWFLFSLNNMHRREHCGIILHFKRQRTGDGYWVSSWRFRCKLFVFSLAQSPRKLLENSKRSKAMCPETNPREISTSRTICFFPYESCSH
jgi:hypothetical protein